MNDMTFDVKHVFERPGLIPEPTARSAVRGVSPGRGLLIPLLGEFKVDDGDEIFSVRWSSLISILWWTIASSSFD